jgi:hypothetical protein
VWSVDDGVLVGGTIVVILDIGVLLVVAAVVVEALSLGINLPSESRPCFFAVNCASVLFRLVPKFLCLVFRVFLFPVSCVLISVQAVINARFSLLSSPDGLG